jgi:hypothetical protein
LFFKVNSQDVKLEYNVENNIGTFTSIIKIDSLSADQIFDELDLWFAKKFVNSKNVIESANKNTHTYIANGSITTKYISLPKCNAYWNFFLEIKCKDGRLKVDVSKIENDKNGCGGEVAQKEIDFFEQEKPSGGVFKRYTTNQWEGMKKNVESQIKELIVSIQDHFKNKTADDDW